MQEQTLPRIDKVLAISGRDDKTGDIIVKVVNSCFSVSVLSASWVRLRETSP
ncbi:MAG: hypothetical protein M3468_10715 [Acidobacteriota bacterium]|nr:hypothetical protein [Acidobacteriota bacterium]